MIKRPELQNEFYGMIQGWFCDPKTKQISKTLTFEDFEKETDFKCVTQEMTRFNDVGPVGFTRQFPKDVTIDGIKFRKGDCWQIGFAVFILIKI